MSKAEIIVGVWQGILILAGFVAAGFQISALRRVPARAKLPAWNAPASSFFAFSGIAVFCVFAVGMLCSATAQAIFPGLIAEKNDVIYLIPATQTLSLLALLFFIKIFPNAFPENLNAAPNDRAPLSAWLLPTNRFCVPALFLVGFSVSAVAAWLVAAVVTLAPESVQAIFRENQILVEAFSRAENPLIPLLCVPAIAIFTPIIEEIIFRAGLYRFLKSKMSAVPAAVLSSIVFALMHDAPISYLPLTLLGCIFCFAYEKTGRLAAPIIVHGLFNANTLLCLAFL